jgi:hypothetical protein
MARVEVAGDQLTVQIEGMDKLWTFKSRLDIPLAHVTDAEADPEVVRGWKGWRGPGVQVPGVIVAGTFLHEGDRVFQGSVKVAVCTKCPSMLPPESGSCPGPTRPRGVGPRCRAGGRMGRIATLTGPCRVFWDVHDPAKAVVIHLADERYARLVIGVDDPAATVAAIRRALGTRGA